MSKWLDDRVRAWHTKPELKSSLSHHLGMSDILYRKWVEHPPAYVLGLDEVGYGAWAGPLVVGAVLAPHDWSHPDLRDSKAFTGLNKERQRAEVLKKLQAAPGASYFLYRTSNENVDKLGVTKALLRSFEELCKEVLLQERDTLIVIDGVLRVSGLEHVALPQADTFVPQVMAASLIAKVARDTEMTTLDKKYPGYGFAKHKGYGTTTHREALKKLGLCALHRKSYNLTPHRRESASTQ